MSKKHNLKANFAVESKHQAFYTGGKVQFSKDGVHMLCRCTDTVSVLDINTGSVIHSYGQEEDGEISCFTLSPDNKILVLALGNMLLKQWNFVEKQLTRTWKAIHTAPVSCMTFDVTSTLLATGGSDSTIKVWDVIQQYCTHNLRGHHGIVTVVEFHPDIDKLQLVSAGEDYRVRVWDLRTSACLAAMEGHYSVITGLQFSTDFTTLYSGGRDQVINVWDLQSFTKTRTVPVYETLESIVLLNQDGDHSELNVKSKAPHIITAGSKGLLRVWNISTAQCVFSQTKQEENGPVIVDAIYSPVLDTVGVVYFDHNISLYGQGDLSLKKQFAGYNDDILAIQLLGPDQSHLVVATNSELIKVFEIKTWDVQILHGHTGIVLSIDVYQNGLLFASSSKDNTIRLWQMNIETQRVSCVGAAYGHTGEILTVTFSQLSASFLVSGSQDLTMKTWTIPTELSADKVTKLQAQITEKAHDKDINSVVVSPNDKLIVSGSQDKTAKLWSAGNLKLLGVFRGHRRAIWCVTFSPVDQCVATASSDCTVKIWSLTDYSCVRTFEGHDAMVLNVNFLCNGMQLITSGSDGLMKLWSIKNNECVKTFDEHEDKIWALAVTRDENRLITGGADSTIIVWKDVTETELEEQQEKQETFILQEQKMLNLLQGKKYLKALALAITLDQPFRALNILKDILGGEDGTKGLQKTLAKMRQDQIDAILRFSVQWNTNSRHCHVAQSVLATIFSTMAPEDIFQLPSAKTSLEGLLPYTEKHQQRMNRLLQQAMFVDYTWQAIRLATDSTLSVLVDQYPVGSMFTSQLALGSTQHSVITSDSSSESDEDMEVTNVIKSTATLVATKADPTGKKHAKNKVMSSDSSSTSDDPDMKAAELPRPKRQKKVTSTNMSSSESSVEESGGETTQELHTNTTSQRRTSASQRTSALEKGVDKDEDTSSDSEEEPCLEADSSDGDSASSDSEADSSQEDSDDLCEDRKEEQDSSDEDISEELFVLDRKPCKPDSLYKTKKSEGKSPLGASPPKTHHLKRETPGPDLTVRKTKRRKAHA